MCGWVVQEQLVGELWGRHQGWDQNLGAAGPGWREPSALTCLFWDLGGTGIQPQGWGDPTLRPAQEMTQENGRQITQVLGATGV